jgi:hypothetical protein
MAKRRKKKRQTERVLEPLVKPGQPLKVPDKAPAITPSRVVVGIDEPTRAMVLGDEATLGEGMSLHRSEIRTVEKEIVGRIRELGYRWVKGRDH